MNTQELLEHVTTEDDALDLINAVSARFDLPTAVIATGDICGTIHDRLGAWHSPAFIYTFMDALITQARSSCYLAGARDQLSEEGNMLVDSAVIDVEELLAPDSEFTYGCEFSVETTNGRMPALEVSGFDTAEQAYLFGIDRMYLPLSHIRNDATGRDVDANPSISPHTYSESMGLVVYAGDERQAYLEANWARHLGRRGPTD